MNELAKWAEEKVRQECEKEKLVELIAQAVREYKCLVGELGDHLIANGVTIPVRCNDCKWFYRDEEFNRAWCGYNKCGANEVAVNGYCYRGERKQKHSE